MRLGRDVTQQLAVVQGDLDLSNERLDDAAATLLATALTGNTSVTVVFLEVNAIGDTGTKALAAMLTTNTTITSITLNRNLISDAGAAALTALAATNTTLTTFELHNNPLSDGACIRGVLFNMCQVRPSRRL